MREICDRAKPWRRGRWISSLRIAEWINGTNENEDGRRKHYERAIKEKYTAGVSSLTSSTGTASTLIFFEAGDESPEEHWLNRKAT
jgi:hypothetical protein